MNTTLPIRHRTPSGTRRLLAALLLLCLTQCADEPDVLKSKTAADTQTYPYGTASDANTFSDTNVSPLPDVVERTDAGQRTADTEQPIDAAPSNDIRGPSPTPEDAAVSNDSSSPDAQPSDDVTPAPKSEPVRYPASSTHSPITPYGSERALAIRKAAANHPENVFMKVGDSISYSNNFLYCFSGNGVNLGAYTALDSTLQFYLSGDAAGVSPFDRKSTVVKGGKTAAWAIEGGSSPLQSEIDAISPSSAVVMFGTNDSGYHPTDTAKMLRWYGESMFTLVDSMITQGVVPILMSIPPRTNKVDIGQIVPLVNAVIRGLAQGHQTPYVDYFGEMMLLPSAGMSSDGVHPNVSGSQKGCVLTANGLKHGYNLRNLLSLEALDRLQTLLSQDNNTWDNAAPVAAGTGAPKDAFVMDALPFTHMSNTSSSPHSVIDAYPGCNASQDESGPEWYYTLKITKSTPLRLVVLNPKGVDVDVHLLKASGKPNACLHRNHTMIEGTLAPGDYVVVLDTFVSGGKPLPGEYLFMAVPCEAKDSRCKVKLN